MKNLNIPTDLKFPHRLLHETAEQMKSWKWHIFCDASKDVTAYESEFIGPQLLSLQIVLPKKCCLIGTKSKSIMYWKYIPGLINSKTFIPNLCRLRNQIRRIGFQQCTYLKGVPTRKVLKDDRLALLPVYADKQSHYYQLNDLDVQ